VILFFVFFVIKLNKCKNLILMKLIIVRHGETNENKNGIIQGHLPGKLSEKGKEQAEKVAIRLQNEPVQYIYSSDLARSVDTAAEIIKYHPGIPVKYTEILRERNLGEFQGKTKEQVGWNSDDHTGFLEPEEGETVNMLFQRGEKVLKLLTSAHPGDSLLIVSHGGIAKAMIAIMEGLGIEGYKSLPTLENTSVSIYESQKEGFYNRILFNSFEHLQ
jgi:broad specificity phosphatase PhoE